VVDQEIVQIRLAGAPRERGRQLGARFGPLAQAYWREILLDLGERAARPMGEAELLEWLRPRAAFAAAIAPDLDEELRGLAEGAEIPYEVAFAINSGNEMNGLAAGRGASTFALPEKRCLSIVVQAKYSATGSVLLGQTWEGPRATPAPWLVTVEENAGASVWLTDPGWIGGAGLNSHGVGTVQTGVAFAGSPVGLGYSYIARRALQQISAAAAAQSATEYPSSSAGHYVSADGGETIDALVAGELRESLPVEGWLTTHAHFDDQRFAALRDPGDRRDSQWRTNRLLAMAAAAAPIEPLTLFELFADHEGRDDGGTVCLHSGELTALGTIVIDVGARTVWASAGSPCERRLISTVRLDGSRR
jgi:isopenicillin-N N-acyltransferase-like protein